MKYAAAVCILVSLAACTAPPVQEMSDARQAVRAAQAAGAADRAPEQLAAAERLVEDAQSHLQRKEYRLAQQAAVEARREAMRAMALSREARDNES